jgi:hypothetical protein
MGVVEGGGIMHGGELQRSEIPFGDITVFPEGSWLGDIYHFLWLMSS